MITHDGLCIRKHIGILQLEHLNQAKPQEALV